MRKHVLQIAVVLMLAVMVFLDPVHVGTREAIGSTLRGDQLSLTSELILSGLDEPTFVTAPGGDADRLFIVEKHGRIKLAKDGVLQPVPFLDIDTLVPDETYNGMLGLCFDPDFDDNGLFYVQHTLGGSSSNRVCVAKYAVSSDPDVADPLSRQVIFERNNPGSPAYHVGGWIGFGPDDGYLYIPLGDGGYSGDATAGNRSQSLTSPWGKVLRVDVHGDDAYPSDPNRNFAIPEDNPFIGSGLGEIWVRGLRNPYRADFDDETGDFWIADVGLYQREEIDVVPAGSGGGQNFGWDCAEGTWCTPNANCNCGPSLSEPVLDYMHSMGCSITGGSVYNGCAIPGMQGRYFYGDWCTGRTWSCRYEEGTATDVQEHTNALNPDGQPAISGTTAIGTDGEGELIVVSQQGRLYRISSTDDEDACGCDGDINGDQVVNVNDLLAIIGGWGNPYDVDDLLAVIAAWGPCS